MKEENKEDYKTTDAIVDKSNKQNTDKMNLDTTGIEKKK